MVYGYEKGFIIEHDDTVRRKLDCRDCCHYLSDRSCAKRPLYLPVDGYNSWKTCNYFEFRKHVSHYAEKKSYYDYLLRTGKIKCNPQQDNSKKPKANLNNEEKRKRPQELIGYSLILSSEDMIPNKCLTYSVIVETIQLGKKEVVLQLDTRRKKAYLNMDRYYGSAIDKVKALFKD